MTLTTERVNFRISGRILLDVKNVIHRGTAETEDVEPTNNHGELELRDFVLWRKRSFGTQSERGERFAERVMTVVRTARKQGKAVLDFLVGCIKGSIQKTTPPRLLGAHPIGLTPCQQPP